MIWISNYFNFNFFFFLASKYAKRTTELKNDAATRHIAEEEERGKLDG